MSRGTELVRVCRWSTRVRRDAVRVTPGWASAGRRGDVERSAADGRVTWSMNDVC